MEHYLDNSATTKVCPEAAQAALAAMTECYGNQAPRTRAGARRRSCWIRRADRPPRRWDAVREGGFHLLRLRSDNWALLSGAEAMARKGRHIISSSVEHDAVRKTLEELRRRGFDVTELKPDGTGAISPQAVMEALREDTILVSLMLVNNETGAVTDISAISGELRRAGSAALVHTDAVQAFMKLPFSPKSLGADMISVSGHKDTRAGHRASRALYVRDGLRLRPYIMGGAQEGGRRAGTEAMPAIAAFGAACDAARADMANIARMAAFKRGIVERLGAAIPEFTWLDTPAPHILSISLPGWRSEVLMNFLRRARCTCQKAPPARRAGGVMCWRPSA